MFTRLLFLTAWSVGLADLHASATGGLRGSGQSLVIRRHLSRIWPFDSDDSTEKVDREDKVQMDPIEVFRSEMCMDRDNLIDHKKCINWMVRKCMKETSGVGSCLELEDYLKSLCVEQGNKRACAFAEELDVEIKKKQEELKAHAPAPAPALAPAPEAPEEESASVPAPAPVEAEEEKDAKEAEKIEEEKAEADKAEPKEAEPKEAEPEKAGEAPAAAAAGEEPAAASPAAATGGAPGTWPKKVHYSKKIRDLPEHGYDEHSERHVQYDGDNHADDWQKEWPMTGESNAETIKSICKKNPDNKWCKRYPFPVRKEEEESLWDTITSSLR